MRVVMAFVSGSAAVLFTFWRRKGFRYEADFRRPGAASPKGNAAGLATGSGALGPTGGPGEFRSLAPAQAPTLELEILGAGHHARPAAAHRRRVGVRDVDLRREDAAAVLRDACDVLA